MHGVCVALNLELKPRQRMARELVVQGGVGIGEEGAKEIISSKISVEAYSN